MAASEDQPVDNVIIALSADDTNPDTVMFPERRLVLTRSNDTMPVGRASKVQSKGFIPCCSNAYFDSPVMSRDHAKFTVDLDKKAVMISDDSSMHGTFVNNERLRIPADSPRELHPGDRVQFGVPILRNTESFPPMSVKVHIYFREPSPSNVTSTHARRASYKVYSDDEDPSGDESSEEDLIASMPRAPSARKDAGRSIDLAGSFDGPSESRHGKKKPDTSLIDLTSSPRPMSPPSDSLFPAATEVRSSGPVQDGPENNPDVDTHSIRLSSYSDDVDDSDYDTDESVDLSELDDIPGSESEDGSEDQLDYSSEDGPWGQVNEDDFVWDDGDAEIAEEEATKTTTVPIVPNISATEVREISADVHAKEVEVAVSNGTLSPAIRQPSPSDAALPKSIRFSNTPRPTTTADVLGPKTGKYDYFAAREANRMALAGKEAPPKDPAQVDNVPKTSNINQLLDEPPTTHFPPIRQSDSSSSAAQIVHALVGSPLLTSGEKFLSSPPVEAAPGGGVVDDAHAAAALTGPASSDDVAMTSAYIFQQHKMAAAATSGTSRRTHVGINDIVESSPQASASAVSSRKRKADDMASCLSEAEEEWEKDWAKALAATSEDASSEPMAADADVPVVLATAEKESKDIARPTKLRRTAERLGYAALGGATVGAMVLGSLIYTAPSFT